MSISSLSRSPTVQYTINNSSTYVYEHFEFIFVASVTLVNTYFDKVIATDPPNSHNAVKCTFYTNFDNCAGNCCLLCRHYSQCPKLCWHNRLTPKDKAISKQEGENESKLVILYTRINKQ